MTISGESYSLASLADHTKVTPCPEIHSRFFNVEGLRVQLMWSFRGDECTASIHCKELGIDITTISDDLDEAIITLGEVFKESLKDLNLLKDSFMFGYQGKRYAPT